MSQMITLIVLAFLLRFLGCLWQVADVTANANGTKIGDTIKIGVNMG